MLNLGVPNASTCANFDVKSGLIVILKISENSKYRFYSRVYALLNMGI